jgi:hypothetical protein
MPRKFSIKLVAAALALSAVPLAATTLPASAQANFRVSFGYFYDSLAPYGQWFHHPRWGDVWQPRRIESDFRPYRRGHWDYTDRFGWVWASDYVWGDIPFHYGRWVFDPSDGWLWVPGYVWSPAWVVYRRGGGYVGWFPMPPDEAFLAGDEVYRTNWDNWDRSYGYLDWYGPRFGPNWLLSMGVFVDERHFADRDFSRFTPRPDALPSIVNNTRNVTNYATVNNYIVNRSVDRDQIQRASGRQIAAVPEREALRANVPIVPVNLGRDVQQQERRQHGGDPKAPAQARIAVLPPEAAHANAPPNNGPGNNRFNRNNREANQPGAQNANPNLANNPREQQGAPNFDRTRRGAPPNEAIPQPPPSGVTANGNQRGGGRFNERGAVNGPPPNAGADAQAVSRDRAAAQAQANRDQAAAQAQANRDQAAAQAQANRDQAAQAQANRDQAAAQAQANRDRAAQAQANRDQAAAQAQANREQASGRPPPEARGPSRAQQEAPPPARTEPPPQQQVNNARNQRQPRDDRKKQEERN